LFHTLGKVARRVLRLREAARKRAAPGGKT